METTQQQIQERRLTHEELAALVADTAEIVESCQRTTASTAAALRDLVTRLEAHL